MISNTDLRREHNLRKLTPLLLAVSMDQPAALCPSCEGQIDEDHPPYDSQVCELLTPQCPYCRQVLDIQCTDIDMSTTFGSMNDAQYLYAKQQFQKLGGSLMKLQSGKYHLLFAGTRSTLGMTTYVLSTWQSTLAKLEDMQMNQRYRGGAYHG